MRRAGWVMLGFVLGQAVAVGVGAWQLRSGIPAKWRNGWPDGS
jgi:hypothetical protein